MSEPQRPPLDYLTATGYGNAPTQVKLAGIFNIVLGGISALAALLYVGMAVFMYVLFTRGIGGTTMPATAMPSLLGLPPQWFIGILYGGQGLLNVVAGTIEILAGMALLKRTPRAFGWGIVAITAAFLSSLSFSLFCILPLGTAVYTLVILCLERPRQFLRQQAAP